MSWTKWLGPDPLGLFKAPKETKTPPDSFDPPATADEGAYIGILFGTRGIKVPNYTFFGDVKQVAIKSKGGKK